MVKSKRIRRGFSAEFKLEAVRCVLERQAKGISLAQMARELDIGPDLLRTWVQSPTPTHEYRIRQPGTLRGAALRSVNPVSIKSGEIQPDLQ